MTNRSMLRSCSIKNCGRNVFARSWCQRHYTSNRRYKDPTYVDSDEARLALSEMRRQNALSNPSRYWLGKTRPKYSTATKLKMRKAKLGVLKTPEHRVNIRNARIGTKHKLSTRLKISATKRNSNLTPRGKRHLNWGVAPRHTKRVEYNGTVFRSMFEVRFAKALDNLGIKWLYEPKRFDLGSCTYLPDFYLPQQKSYWETKGWMGPDSIRKIKLFRENYPDVPLIVATNPVIKQLENLKWQPVLGRS